MAGVDTNGNCLKCGRKVAGTMGCPCSRPEFHSTSMTPTCPKCGGLLSCTIIMGDPSHPASGTHCPRCDVVYNFEGTLDEARAVIAELQRQVAELQARAKKQDEKIERLSEPRRELNVGLQACSVAAGTKAPLFRNIFDLAGYIRELRAALESAEVRAKQADDDADKENSRTATLYTVLSACRTYFEALPAGSSEAAANLLDLINEALSAPPVQQAPDEEPT